MYPKATNGVNRSEAVAPEVGAVVHRDPWLTRQLPDTGEYRTPAAAIPDSQGKRANELSGLLAQLDRPPYTLSRIPIPPW